MLYLKNVEFLIEIFNGELQISSKEGAGKSMVQQIYTTLSKLLSGLNLTFILIYCTEEVFPLLESMNLINVD